VKRLAARLGLVAALGAAFCAYTTWPILNAVETGKTPEYPDLKPRDYGASVESVTRSLKGVLGRLPRWRLVGEGKGPAGGEVQAVRTALVPGVESEVTIRLRREGGRTRVSVKSISRDLPWDLGHNARIVRELLAALDREAF
jgi:hypothetical protein